MKVAIIGYGKMGHTIERILLSRGHEVVLKVNSSTPVTAEQLESADLAIEFSIPQAAVENIRLCFKANIPVVTGTTGWFDNLPEVRYEAESNGHSLFYATNFSVGVNLFQEIIRAAARKMAQFESYTPSMVEIHHTEKKDAPSGTALTMADIMLDEYDSLTGWTEDSHETQKLHIKALREGDVKGTHSVMFTSDIDRITLTHEAFSRDGFALGAVMAAEWLKNRKGVFTMRDMLKHLLP